MFTGNYRQCMIKNPVILRIYDPQNKMVRYLKVKLYNDSKNYKFNLVYLRVFSITLKCHNHHLDQLFIFNWVHVKLWASADTGVTQTFQLSPWQG